MKPSLFIFGPSGVGKSHVSRRLHKNGFLYVHIDTDRTTRTFAANGLPKEWDEDFRSINVAHLVDGLNRRVDTQKGFVVSFPTSYLFTLEMLGESSELGVTPILLWGTREHCMKAADERMRRKGMTFNRSRYERLNEPTFVAYGSSEYDSFRVEAFQHDGSRFLDEGLVLRIMQRTNG